MSEKLNFRDINLEGIRSPCGIKMIDANTAIISDWDGYLTTFDLVCNKIINQVYMHKYPLDSGHYPRSLCLQANEQGKSGELLCAIAPQYSRFITWRVGGENCEHHSTQTGGLVRSVAFSPSGKYLAAGLGFYSLSHQSNYRVHRADLEIWGFEGEKLRCYNVLSLPGISVDAICWRYDSKEIACLTGFRHQRGGVITLIDENLRPYAFIEVLYSMASNISYMDYFDKDALKDGFTEYVEPKNLVVSHSTGVEAISLEGDDCHDLDLTYLPNKDYRTQWLLKNENKIPDFTCNPLGDRILLTDGRLLLSNGRIITRLPLLEDCISVAYRPGGGYVGVSKKGILRCWKFEKIKPAKGYQPIFLKENRPEVVNRLVALMRQRQGERYIEVDFEQRLREVLAEYPDIDREMAAMALTVSPKASTSYIAFLCKWVARNH